MKKVFFAFAVMALCLLSGCDKKKEVYKINLFEDNPYLAEVWWGDDYDSEAAMENMTAKLGQLGKGGCSSWHKANFHGRNIDWTMHEYATVIVHMPRTEKVKYASVGLIAGLESANRAFIENNEYIPEEMRSWLPASIVDGINECGVACNHNIVPYDGRPYISEGDLYTTMVCRYVLDNAATADEAVELLKAKKVIQAVVKIAGDYSHFLISDPTCSYVVEWINGEMIATKFTSDGQGNYYSESGRPAIMTNYFVAEAEKCGYKTNEFFTGHKGAGVERADLIESQLPAAETVEDHLNICKSVWYKQFCEGTTDWATENAGSYGLDPETGKAYWTYKDVKHMTESDDVYAAAKELLNSDEFQEYYEDFKNGGNVLSSDNNNWFTQHSVVYDINAKKGYVIVQEGMFSEKVVEVEI